jgi:hypothetical protein
MLITEGNRKRLNEATEKVKGSNNGFLFQAGLWLEPIHWPPFQRTVFSFKAGLFDQGNGFRLLYEATQSLDRFQ